VLSKLKDGQTVNFTIEEPDTVVSPPSVAREE
jgi:hypothetical protein